MHSKKASSTALLIAGATAALGRDPVTAPLVPTGAAEVCGSFLEAAQPGSQRRLEATPLWRLRLQLRLFELLGVPGITLHYLARKRCLEEISRQALDRNVEQVVVLGAGLDTLCFRLHRDFPQALFVECDHPATQELKRRALASRPGPNLSLVPIDLTQESLAEALLGLEGFRRAAPTLVIAEGLLMYLEEKDVRRVFAAFAECAGPASCFAFTFLEPRPDGRVGFAVANPLVDLWLRWKAEPFRWGVPRGDLSVFLASEGLALESLWDDDTLRERWLKPAGLAHRRIARGECVALARKGLRPSD